MRILVITWGSRLPRVFCCIFFMCIILCSFHLSCLCCTSLGPWSYGSWISNYLWNRCLSPLMLWVRISIRSKCTNLCDKVCRLLATGRWFSPVSSTNKTDRHDIIDILLKVTLNIISLLFLNNWKHRFSHS
jgi:hypothetical protein